MKPSAVQSKQEEAEDRHVLTRRLYRYITEASRKVDEGTARSKTSADLFSPALSISRQKLRDNCEKLTFADPLLYGRKAQELLWRKGYYEAVRTAKKLSAINNNYDNLLLAHIEAGIGHYHRLILKLQMDFNIEMKNIIDFPILDVKPDETDAELKVWAKSCIQTCLVYLGDLARYKTDFEDVWDPSMAARYYLQAAAVNPWVGMPYNQLGTLYTGKNYQLDSVRYYILCLSCTNSFEGADGNLMRILDKNAKYLETLMPRDPDIIDQQESVKNFICKFISLADNWFYQKDFSNFNEMCTSALYEFKECLEFRPLSLPDMKSCHEEYVKYLTNNEISPEYLSPKLIYKVVIIIILCMNNLQKNNSDHLLPLKAFTLGALSQLFQRLLSEFKDMGFQIQKPNDIIESYKQKLRDKRQAKHQMKNGFHTKEETVIKDAVIELSDKVDALEIKEENKTENVGAEKEPNNINTIENTEDSKEVDRNEMNGEEKSSKIKPKKSLILQKIRRRRRRLDSGSDSDRSETDQSTDESDCEIHKNDSDDETESEGEGEESDESYSSCTSSEEEENEPNKEVKEPGQNGVAKLITDEEKEAKECVADDVKDKANVKPEIKEEPIIVKEFNEGLFKNFIESDSILMALRLLIIWLYEESELIISCGANGKAMFETLIDILNVIHRQIFTKLLKSNEKEFNKFQQIYFKYKYQYRSVPLPEDYECRGIAIMDKGLKSVDWEYLRGCQILGFEANTVRLMKFLDFGFYITKLNVGITYNKHLKLYLFRSYNKKFPTHHTKLRKPSNIKHHQKRSGKPPAPLSSPGGSPALIQSLGRLWLGEQVRQLEQALRRERGRARPPRLPAYAVVDAPALCKHMPRVRQVAATEKVIVLVPSVVLQSIDELKKESPGARSAIRWLETQLQNGSRFLRAQRPTETTPLPYIKYPKKMHRDGHNFVQIIEFCHYFISKEQAETKNDEEDNQESKNNDNIIVLLTGSDELLNNAEQKDFSYAGIAQSAGVTIENINDFCAKFKNSFGKGNNRKR